MLSLKAFNMILLWSNFSLLQLWLFYVQIMLTKTHFVKLLAFRITLELQKLAKSSKVVFNTIMENKTYQIISICVLVAILGAFGFFVFSNGQKNNNPKQAQNTTSSSVNVNDPCKFRPIEPTAKILPTIVDNLKMLKIEDTKEGTGNPVKTGDQVCIHYRGTLTDGQEFDSSYKRNMPFVTPIGYGRVIEGWDIGIVGLKEGGKRKLTIPPQLAYKDRSTGTIPANSTLVFEVELVKIQAGK